jgi:predicted Zn-dependent protease with MMP-like domain
MTDAEFEKLVIEGIDALPERVRRHMQNVAITIEDDVSDEEREELELGPHETLFGHYHGVPLTERDSHYAALPDKITIYKEPILAHYSDEEDIRQCVANTVWHEVAHHYGYGEEWVDREEVRRGKIL